QQKQERKQDGIDWNGDHGLSNAAEPCQVSLILSPQQGPFEQVAPLPTLGRHGFVNDRFVAPREYVPFIDHSPKEIRILRTTAKLSSERLTNSSQDALSEQDISGSTFPPTNHGARRVLRSLAKSAPDEPPWWRLLEKRLDRP